MTGRRPRSGEPAIGRVERALRRCAQWSQSGRHRRVLEETDRLLALLRGEPRLEAEVLIWKAQSLLAMGHDDLAEQAASRSWELSPAPHACHLLASALCTLGDPDEAERLLQLGAEMFPEAAHLPVQLAMIQADQGRVPEALDTLENIDRGEDIGEDLRVFAVGLKANLLAASGQWQAAERALLHGLDRYPKSEILREAQVQLFRAQDRLRAEQELTRSWRTALAPLDDAAAEVDDAVRHCVALLELPTLVELAARRMWRAFLTADPVRAQAPDAWAAALVGAVLELDGIELGSAHGARAIGAAPRTVCAARRRLRAYLHSLEPQLAARSFAAISNPQLDSPSRSPDGESIVVAFPTGSRTGGST